MPPWLTRLRLRVGAAFSRGHDRALREELQLHLQLLEDDYVAHGLSRAEAQAAAHREFGNATRIQEASHDLFSFRFLEEFVHDIAFAFREMRRSVGFTVIAIGSLALAIGAVTATFSVIDAFLLRGLPVPEPDRLVAFSVSNSRAWRRWSYAHYERWRERSKDYVDVAASMSVDRFNVSTLQYGRPEEGKVRISLVSGNYFRVLRMPIALGEALADIDDRNRGSQPAAVISDAFWLRALGSRSDVVGRHIHLNGVSYAIVGVAARGFTGEWIGQPTDIWIPLAMHGAVLPESTDLFGDLWGTGAQPLRVIGRLWPTAGVREAEAQANVVFQQFLNEREGIEVGRRQSNERTTHVDFIAATQGYSPERAEYFRPLMTLSAIVAMVLVVAFANFANLLLGRSEIRQSEYSVRLALGAGRWRLVRQTLTECAVLGTIAGVLGLVASRWLTTGALKKLATTVQPMEFDGAVTARVIAIDVACIALVVLVGLWPAMRAACSAVTLSLVQRSSNLETPRRRRLSAGRVLMAGQLALCTVLLIGAAMFLRTVINLRSQYLGFDRNVLLVNLAPVEAGYRDQAATMLVERVTKHLSGLPHIGQISASGASPLDQATYWIDKSERLTVDSNPVPPGKLWTFAEVGPGFFRTVGMPLLLGRDFTEADLTAVTGSVIINRALATLLFGSENPLGRRVSLHPNRVSQQVIGVVDDVKQTSPRDQGLGVIYMPLKHADRVVLAIRTGGPPEDFATMINFQIRSVAPNLPITRIDSIEQQLDDAIAQERLIGTVSIALAVMAILIACVGLHALLSNDVTQRTREIGVRLAMGATTGNVVTLVLNDTLRVVAVALVIGIPIGVAATRPLTTQFYGIEPQDPSTLALVALAMVAATALASARPAHAAIKTDPVALLRDH